MKKNILTILITLGFAVQVFGQATEKGCEELLKGFDKEYKDEYDKYEKFVKDFKSLGGEITVNSLEDTNKKLNAKKTEIESSVKVMDTIRKVALAYEIYCVNQKKISKEDAEKCLQNIKKYTPEIIIKKTEPSTELQVYTYLSENQIINHDVFKNKTTESEILKSVLLEKGEESYLGDITIPKENQEFNFYKYCENPIKKNCLFECYDEENLLEKEKTFKFKKLDVEIRDGYFYDIRTFVETHDGNTHVFTNQVGLSLLFYSQQGKRKNLLRYEYSLKANIPNKEYTDEKMANLYIKVTDVMGYSYKPGNRYIPHDIILELPKNDTDNKSTNSQNRATYQIKQETHLEKILELRTYTDFLALFGKSDNGLAQIEGKAKFYLFPYPFRFFGSKKTLGQIEYFPSLSPYVNYSRFEDGTKYVDKVQSLPNVDSNVRYEPVKHLDLVERRYLSMGVDFEFLKWQHKNAPVKFSIYATFNYNLSEVNMGDESNIISRNIKAFNRGGGLHLSTKRFNNFGFDLKAELTWYDYKNFNDDKDFILPDEIPIFRNEAELFYHPNKNPNQAVFTRLITFNYAGRSNNQAFYQFQFGYKFAIGNRTVSK